MHTRNLTWKGNDIFDSLIILGYSYDFLTLFGFIIRRIKLRHTLSKICIR